MLAFFYGPVSVLIFFNCLFFVLLMINLRIFKCTKSKDVAREARSTGTKGVASQKNKSVAFPLSHSKHLNPTDRKSVV